MWWDLTIFNPGTSHLITIDNWCLFMVGWVWCNSQGSPLEPLAARVLGTVSPTCDLEIQHFLWMISWFWLVHIHFFEISMLDLVDPQIDHIQGLNLPNWDGFCKFHDSSQGGIRTTILTTELTCHTLPFLTPGGEKASSAIREACGGGRLRQRIICCCYFPWSIFESPSKKMRIIGWWWWFSIYSSTHPRLEMMTCIWTFKKIVGPRNRKNANFAGGQVVTLWPWQVMASHLGMRTSYKFVG